MNGVVAWCIGLEGGKLKTQPSKGKVKGVETKSTVPQSRRMEPQVKVAPKESAAGAEEEDDLAAQDAAADAAGWESGSVNSDGDDDDADRYPLSDAESSDSDAISLSEPPAKRPRTLASSVSPPPPKATKKGPAGSSSLFLPTLASGFTMGSYDSDPDEDERRDKKSGKGGLIQSVRKNRRGQAERRK